MNQVIPFEFEKLQIRVVAGDDGEPLFVGKDVCDALGYANHNKAMGDHCKGVTKRYPLQTSGGTQEYRVIGEPDMMRLIVNSTLPSAEAFERTVFEEILPTIRKTGAYSSSDQLAVPQTLPEALRLAADLAEKNQKITNELAIAAPKAAVADRIACAEGSISLREASNTLRVPERKFVLWLQQHDWVYRRAGHKSLLAYSDKVKAGFLFLKQTPITDVHTGQERLSEQVRVTPLGLTELAKRLDADGMMERAA